MSIDVYLIIFWCTLYQTLPPFRFERNGSSGGVIARDDIPNKLLIKHKLPDEVNVRKTKWLIFGTYHPPSKPVEYFLHYVGYALNIYIYRQTCGKFFLAGDFNTEKTKPSLSKCLTGYDSKNLAKGRHALKILKTQDA